MSTLSDIVYVSENERPFVNFELSINNDEVISGYIPVKSTLDVFAFLGESASIQSPRGRSVICWGAYGSGKSRLCTVLARLFRDGFECKALAPVWQRFEARGHGDAIESLRHHLMPGGRKWRPWLVVPLYSDAGGGSLTACLIRALTKAVRSAGLDDHVLRTTIYQEASNRLREMLNFGTTYTPLAGAVYQTAEMLTRALERDLDEQALEEFCEFHRRVTFGFDFRTYVQTAGGSAVDVHDVYNEVVENIQQAGYDGIIVLWDEMGFFIEQLLSGARAGTRNLGQEAMALQGFLERSCGTRELGKRIIFLGFTHVGITEYGTRGHLNDQDQNRLATVAARFRQPDINIRLSVTETEGYHLVAGMIQRTPKGDELFSNPMPRLQRLADRMRRVSKNWEHLSAEQCYDEVAAPCYPMHPATVMVLLLLSDQIAQVNRTTFYYLQSQQEGGLAALLRQRALPPVSEIGTIELARLPDLFRFFEQPLRARDGRLCEQYDDALVRIPDASELEIAIVRSVLILHAARVSATTSFLSFCLCDGSPTEPQAQAIQTALARLSDAGALWQNAATDVWSFVGGGIIRSEIEREIEDEMDLIPSSAPTTLFRNTPEIHSEIADFIGDFDLDPSGAGIIRRITVKVLHMAKGREAVEQVNPAIKGDDSVWRAAIVYLVAPETPQELAFWRDEIRRCDIPNAFFVCPQATIAMSGNVRELIAVRRVLGKKNRTDPAYKVLESKLTKLRQELRREFSQTFGNAGLSTGTEIVRAGPTSVRVAVESWNELLPSIASTLDADYAGQLRVRCGTYNEWQTGSSWSAIEHVVSHILGFDENPSWQDQYLGFKQTSQEAAIIDGILLENNVLRHHAMTDKWEFAPLEEMGPVVQEAAKHLQSGGAGEKEFLKLYARLIEPPYGIPNGIIPIVTALVIRTDSARIAVYHRAGGQLRRVESKLDEAVVDMAKDPGRYYTRYTKLSGKQRYIFKALGPEVGVEFTSRDDRGEPFYSFCSRVRDNLIEWASPLPEEALQFPDITDVQKRLLRMLRGGVPPQASLLADALLAVVGEDAHTHEEMGAADSDTREFPETIRKWRSVREGIDRHVAGVRASLDRQVREIAELQTMGGSGERAGVVEVLQSITAAEIADNPIRDVATILATGTGDGDVSMQIASVIAKKDVSKLTAEDFGVATGVLKMAKVMREMSRRFAVVLPSGRRELPDVANAAAGERIAADVSKWLSELGLSPDELASLAIRAIYEPTGSAAVDSANNDSPDGGPTVIGNSNDDVATVIPDVLSDNVSALQENDEK